MKQSNKTALVTGASRGIGAATAIALAKDGYIVIINYKSNTKAAESVLKECDKFSNGHMIIKADLSDTKQVKQMLEKIGRKYKKLDVLVNNVGVFNEKDSPANLDAFEEMFTHNFLSQVATTKYALRLMKTGAIINISSIHGRLGHGRPSAIAYASMKAALESYTKNLAKDLAPKIRVNAIAPGRVATAIWGTPRYQKQHKLGDSHLIKRMIEPEEIADAVLFLVKNQAVCGEIMTIDGGMSLSPLNRKGH